MCLHACVGECVCVSLGEGVRACSMCVCLCEPVYTCICMIEHVHTYIFWCVNVCVCFVRVFLCVWMCMWRGVAGAAMAKFVWVTKDTARRLYLIMAWNIYSDFLQHLLDEVVVTVRT